MSIFKSIFDKIFHHPNAAKAAAPVQKPTTPAAPPRATTAPAPAPKATPTPPPQMQQPVDVDAVLSSMAEQKGGGGNWRTSIVDLLKLLDLDSSLAARKQLAAELNVQAAPDGSAEQNMALHKAVMRKLAENGGKVPASLKD